MQKLFFFYRAHSFFIGIYSILITSIFLRVYNFQNRIGLGGDSGRDAMIAQVALARHEIPLFASFSSAGPFVFGPLFYWFNMLSYVLNPFTYEAPWIITSMVGILTVMAMTYIGYLTGGKRLSLLLGLLMAFSPQFIARSTFLSQHGFVGVSCTFLLLFFILYYKTGKLRHALLMGISLGVALSMHYQALNLIIFLPILLFIPRKSLKKRLLSVLIMFVGFLLPTSPLLYWDSRQSFANTNNILDFMLIGQYRMYVANSWKLYLLNALPEYWSHVVGGYKQIAYLVMGITGVMFLYGVLKRKVTGEIFFSGLILGILLIIIRYYKGERFEGYLIYVAPFIFLLSGWALLQLYDVFKNIATRILGKKRVKISLRAATFTFILLLLVIVGADFKDASQFVFAQNPFLPAVKDTSLFLAKKYPGEKFAVYDYLWKTSGDTYGLSLYLKASGTSDPNGHPIGVIGNNDASLRPEIIIGKFYGSNLVDLKVKKESMVNSNWTPVNAENIYDDLITRWTTRQKLTTTFSLPRFLMNKLKGD